MTDIFFGKKQHIATHDFSWVFTERVTYGVELNKMKPVGVFYGLFFFL